ncbi:class III lanthionine synthetase LanKC [Kribbella sp. NPDC051587]|uniref:class III lanthionine synthetase LanKC n=1 Tax=Kribbella sp. NPDC051587 TaxID=3364119 RepID=UPI0037B59BF9
MIDSFRAYTISDPQYYDRVERSSEPGAFLELLRERVGEKAAVLDGVGIWARCLDRPLTELPEYGWKLHLSARPDDLATLMHAVIDEYLVDSFSFKVIRSPELGLAQVARWWSRGGAGKAVTIYPLSEEHARELADRLSVRLGDLQGSHILTDRRYPGSDVVQYRYGTFRKPPGVDDDGYPISVVTGPDGKPWNDSRTPTFTLPSWVADDPFAVPAEAEDADPTGLLKRYKIKSVLRHSPAGGVYLATGPDGAEYVLKEARPHTAFAPDGSDAPDRLWREYDYLKQLAGTGIAPDGVELVTVWEHTFLVQSKVPGITMQVWLSRNHPFAVGKPDPTYPARAQAILEQIRTALATCLERGIVYSDVSLTNIMIDDDDVVRLVDFEACRPVGSDPAQYPRTSGFAPEPGTAAWGSDAAYVAYGVDAIEAATVMPRNALLAFRPEVFSRALAVTARQLDVPLNGLQDRLDLPVASENTLTTPSASSDVGVLAEVVRGLRNAATPERRDRLFPGHPEQFQSNTLSLAYGAAGVLRALHLLDESVDAACTDWLLARLDENRPLPMGLYVGRAGIGLALLELGLDDRGLLAGATTEALSGDKRGGLATGLAGVGVAQLYAHRLTGDQRHLDHARAIADRLIDRASDDGTGLWWQQADPHPLGLLHGSAGVATYLTELGVATDDSFLVKMGRRALGFDLAQGRPRFNGGIGFGAYTGSSPFEPYVVRGGSGVGLAVAHHLRLTGDETLVDPLWSIVRGVGMPFTVNPGYFAGMSGLIEFLLEAKAALPDDAAALDVTIGRLVEQITALRCEDESGTGFPGDGLMRQSCDVASGSAGVAMTLHRLQNGGDTLDVRFARPAGVLSHAG